MGLRRLGWLAGVLAVCLAGRGERAGAQWTPTVSAASTVTAKAALDTTIGGALRSLASRASAVFVGQVVKIEPKVGVVEVTFAVEQSVLGAAGPSYTLREWAGLWTGGRQRYSVGERAMVFVRGAGAAANGVAGLSAPVDGMEGVVPVVGTGAGAVLDVRRLAARLLRSPGTAMVGEAVALSDGARVAAAWQSAAGLEPTMEPTLVPLPGEDETRVKLSRVSSGAERAGR